MTEAQEMLARALKDLAAQFYQNGDNEKRFEQWKKEKSGSHLKDQPAQ